MTSLWATPLALNCVRKSIAKKMTIAFFLFALNAKEERGETRDEGGRREMADGRSTAYFTCHNDKDSLPREMRDMIARRRKKEKNK